MRVRSVAAPEAERGFAPVKGGVEVEQGVERLAGGVGLVPISLALGCNVGTDGKRAFRLAAERKGKVGAGAELVGRHVGHPFVFIVDGGAVCRCLGVLGEACVG